MNHDTTQHEQAVLAARLDLVNAHLRHLFGAQAAGYRLRGADRPEGQWYLDARGLQVLDAAGAPLAPLFEVLRGKEFWMIWNDARTMLLLGQDRIDAGTEEVYQNAMQGHGRIQQLLATLRELDRPGGLWALLRDLAYTHTRAEWFALPEPDSPDDRRATLTAAFAAQLEPREDHLRRGELALTAAQLVNLTPHG